MELRDIEIFLVLAEELHFGRTAQRLLVSQARVSQAIRKQERRIGAALFERTSRTVRLTGVGRQLRDDLQPVYAGLHESLERARSAARGVTGRLRVGMMPFNVVDLHPYWRAFRARLPRWELEVRQLDYVDPFGRLRAGDVDVLVTWLPVEEPDLTVGPVLCTNPRILAVAADHELAGRTSARLEMFADFRHAVAPGMPEYWEDSYLPFQTFEGRRIERGRPVTNAEELINQVGMGEIIHSFPSHVARHWGMPNIRWIPVTDLAPLSFALVWRTEAECEPITVLADTVRDLGALRF
ncbi:MULTISPECIES: LysR family transcriptional regulator [Streptomyces]|uniref:LysR-family transcriptional regulatory protein n=1 Tax=Streptomyces venezuelae (strain ATCC 10712 / CBS 650.69 / DSM 40230 / JCM 4526 / NBRC 13096 / PD 04745) TaxID=953739 RepID=F2RBM3_STRVP|nr:LysR family transcriptional regulator [Streptomyces venezuelae]APE22537.1 LysR family transcriptional regulator [Streptomyces venezuelae]QER99918.1 LysR family transcriptional regulator [Streptomyces venezuelae ATCC 10712]CCA56734.1 LysR-family transcriptional regulatory protein [Streptomyces venezuelae ATCC 10712]